MDTLRRVGLRIKSMPMISLEKETPEPKNK
jgi:hypothetical protein